MTKGSINREILWFYSISKHLMYDSYTDICTLVSLMDHYKSTVKEVTHGDGRRHDDRSFSFHASVCTSIVGHSFFRI